MLQTLHWIDNLLNSITMYRLVLYGLIFLSVTAILFSALKFVPFPTESLFISLIIVCTVTFVTNYVLSKIYNAPTNHESFLITALILFLLMFPPSNTFEAGIVALASVIAITSKFIIARNRKHIFNPVAIAAVLLGAVGLGYTIWWVGAPSLFLPTLIVGLLIVRKIRKFTLFLTFLASTLITQVIFGLINGSSVIDVLSVALLSGPVIFLGTIMLTEPQTMAPKLKTQVVYGLIVGILSGTHFKVGPFFSTPELALVIGNLYSYYTAFKQRLILIFEQKNLIAKDTYEFIFASSIKPKFEAGQYMEWTLPQTKLDARGNRRYFTIASSPTEDKLKLGVRFNPNPSQFKQKMLALNPNEKIIASQLAGDFTLPKDTNKKLVFIAGGIGITPFRSIIKNLIDKQEKRSIVLFYANKTEDEIAFRQFFEEAEKLLGIGLIYILSEVQELPAGLKGETGRITEAIINKHVPDYKERLFYLSGPIGMVNGYKHLLMTMGVSQTSIVTDYFPGF